MSYFVGPFFIAGYSFVLYWFLGRRSILSVKWLGVCLAMGVVSASAGWLVEYGWHLLTRSFIESHPGYVFLESFVGVSLIEELLKWIWFPFVIRHWPHWQSYTQGVLFACALAAGFNLVEGMLYAITYDDISYLVIRGFTAVPSHFLFGVIMGFLMSRYRFEAGGFLWHSLWIPVVLHGIYDFFVLQTFSETLMGGALLILFGCLVLSVWVCRTALRVDAGREIL